MNGRGKTIRVATLVLVALMAIGCEEMGTPTNGGPEPPKPPTTTPASPPIWTDDIGMAQSWIRETAITAFTVPPVDAGHPPPTYIARGVPSGLQFTPSTRRIAGTPDTVGIGTIVVTATNASGSDTWSMSWTVTVPPEPEPPPEPGPVFRSCRYARGAADGFNIEIVYAGELDQWLREEINCAAAYWEQAITSDIGAAVTAATRIPGCDSHAAHYRGRQIDDLMIVVHFADQRTPATAWACQERDRIGLPAVARIAFASSSERYDMPQIGADPNISIDFTLIEPHLDFLYNLARHEIGHALGFGSSSAFRALVSDGAFRGTNAMAQAGGGPIRMNSGGHHWRDLRADIMYARIFSDQVVTGATMGAMDDIGYTVDYGLTGR